VKTYIGQRGRDKVLRVWVEHHGRRYPIRTGDLPRRILADLYGLALPREDIEHRCAEFRQTVIDPRLQQSQWTLSETEVRAWNANYVERNERLTLRFEEEPDEAAEDPPDTPERTREPRRPTPGGIGTAGQDLLVTWGKEVTVAKILHVTHSVILLEGPKPRARHALKAGTLVRVGRPGRPPSVPARLAADGQGARYLLALGLRAVRGTQRHRVNIPAIVGATGLQGLVAARIVDLSSSGARVRGLTLQPGADCEVSFVPPGRRELVTTRSVVVHQQKGRLPPEIGVAFRGAGLEYRLAPVNAQDLRPGSVGRNN
jgi:PilZ domain